MSFYVNAIIGFIAACIGIVAFTVQGKFAESCATAGLLNITWACFRMLDRMAEDDEMEK